MNTPTMLPPRAVAPDTTLLPACIPVPGLGTLPVNAFVIGGRSPVLVDTGIAALGPQLMEALRDTLDLDALEWIWLTHVDADHAGNLARVLAEAPRARVVTTFLGMGKMGMQGLPIERIRLLNPGQSLDLGDRKLTALTPPAYDAPETTALYDSKSRALFTSDCFGALLEEPAECAEDVQADALRDGSVLWGSVDAPWLAGADALRLEASFASFRRLAPDTILGSHLPPAGGAMLDVLLGHVAGVRTAAPFAGPDQEALERMLAA